MRRTSFFKICISFSVITFIGAFSGYSTVPSPQTVQEAKPITLLSSSASTTAYIVKERNGAVAIYSKLEDNTLKLYEEYETKTAFLPEADRIALKKGIEVKSLSDALILVENYSM